MADWKAQALCGSDPDPDVFYPDPSDRARILEAKALCVVCPVRRACGDAAADGHERHGIHGGYLADDPDEWAQLHSFLGRPAPARKRATPKPAVCSQCGREFVPRVPEATKCSPCNQGLVAAGPTIARVKALRDADWTFAAISQASGVSYTAVQSVLKPGRGRVAADTEQRILAVEVAPEQTGAP
ncbi:WhiB family transcriptional regulator [Nocardia sp. BSTN01]|uniref:WhiB family transcriptional regulator n=1 Tax=Nocardia sp. BSTN01 TaxID=2783665 RepID=UPI00188E48F2|nr:WhiB family transcriptional regulator [Nocardia sp. BSTN01]MBF5002379.1 WhiB family transcriptional regulator [Nocardia sp. BSTN01]